jgi:hypothetical protein
MKGIWLLWPSDGANPAPLVALTPQGGVSRSGAREKCRPIRRAQGKL